MTHGARQVPTNVLNRPRIIVGTHSAWCVVKGILENIVEVRAGVTNKLRSGDPRVISKDSLRRPSLCRSSIESLIAEPPSQGDGRQQE
jgi:hypothetical protein